MTTEFYELEAPDSPWGDYGNILQHGMDLHLPPKDGLTQLERTGPFIAPITFPTCAVIVTDAFRKDLAESRLTGLKFAPVIKARIVRLDWHDWDREAKEPPKYPPGGEPSNYILKRKHSEELSRQMGKLWQLDITGKAGVRGKKRIVILSDTWNGKDFVITDFPHTFVVTARAREWLLKRVAEWVSFKPIRSE